MRVWDYIIFLVTGRLYIFLLQENPYTRSRLGQVGECDLCLGFWVYLAQSLMSRQTLSGTSPNPSVLDMVATASLSTILTHFLRLGARIRLG